MNRLIKRAFYNALATVAYITIVVTLMTQVERFFSDKEDNFLMPVAFLLLFVTSAAITSGLVLGKPVLMYMDGNKKEAIQLFLYTLGWMAVGVILMFILALSISPI